MDSFLSTCKDQDLIERWIICDDGSSQEDLDSMKQLYPFFEIHKNPGKGQAASLSHLFSLPTTEWIFHCEDDWEFLRVDNYIRKLYDIAVQDQKFKNIILRDWGGDLRHCPLTDVAYTVHRYDPSCTDDGQIIRTDCHWFGYSFNPGLQHLPTLRELNPGASTFDITQRYWDKHIAFRYYAKGYLRANLIGGYIKHLGDERSVYTADPANVPKVILVTHKNPEEIKDQVLELMHNTPESYNLNITGKKSSASVNRNEGLKFTTAAYIVMLDDDIRGFYPGWLTDAIRPLKEDPNIVVSSARLLNLNGQPGPMIGGFGIPTDKGVYDASPSGYKGYRRVPTACITIRNDTLRFDEGFIGSGYEDTAYMNEVNITYPGKRIVVNNDCRLIHINEEKNQGGKYFEHNHARYMELFPDDEQTRNQKDWTRRAQK
jgi:glycosyltransferase involved in cell wall biosynthesis